MAKLEGLTLSATATVQEAIISDPQAVSTLKNDDASTTLWFKFHPNEDETAGGLAAALRADLWGELKPGEAVSFTGVPTLYYVCATGESLTARILPGKLAESTNVSVSANIGNVGLLDAAEAEINPAKEDGNLATLAGAVGGTEMQVDIVDAGTLALEAGNLATLLGVMSPTAYDGFAAVKTAASDVWDGGQGSFDMEAGSLSAITTAYEVHVHVDQDAYLWTDNTSANSACPVACAIYAGGVTHEIKCRGNQYLHFKNAAAGVNVTVAPTVFGV